MSHNIRRAGDRGATQLGWLQSYHLFSFGSYVDPDNVHFGALRVVNDDTVSGGMGFDNHTHENMEIISIVLSGVLEHRDSMGGNVVLGPGDVQVTTAGVGITHSEFNASKDEPVHFLQIWIEPKEQQLSSSYEEKHQSFLDVPDTLHIVASGCGDEGALPIQRDARVMVAMLTDTASVSYTMTDERHGVLVYVVTGEVEVMDEILSTGGQIRLNDVAALTVNAKKDTQLLMIDVPLE
jgi:redox-sensitive bicupin YhaK (pirin superfamily)